MLQYHFAGLAPCSFVLIYKAVSSTQNIWEHSYEASYKGFFPYKMLDHPQNKTATISRVFCLNFGFSYFPTRELWRAAAGAGNGQTDEQPSADGRSSTYNCKAACQSSCLHFSRAVAIEFTSRPIIAFPTPSFSSFFAMMKRACNPIHVGCTTLPPGGKNEKVLLCLCDACCFKSRCILKF